MPDLLSSQFLYALATIVVIDLVLAGDNAILIAMAARRLPPDLQRRAIVWGMVGAIGVRVVMTLAVMWLLRLPALRAVGGVLLLWITWKLLTEPETEAGHAGDVPEAATGFAGAVRTIVVADAVMGVDNALGVGGAAHDNVVLVVLGLLISIPIVVWGSSVLLRWIERFPVIVQIGGAVLAFTSASMIVREKLFEGFFAGNDWAVWGLRVLLVGGALAVGRWMRWRHDVDTAEA
jgi:YjbE family integral membrane protein